MVGVPRSQGCRQCRRRKKGCDLNRPSCSQCQRLNLQCAWEEPRWTFVSQTMEVTEASAAHPSRLSISRQSESTRRPSATSSSSSRSMTPVRHLGLERTVVEQQITDMFWRSYMPDNTGRVYIDGISTTFSEVLQELAASDELVNLACQATAFAALGCSFEDEDMLQQGSRFYGRALIAANRALQQPDKAKSDAMLAAIKFLGYYETWRKEKNNKVSTQGRDWQKHVLGTCKLVEMRGPDAHVAPTGHAHALFREARGNSTIVAFIMRKPSIFSSPDWSVKPWMYQPRTLRDQLFDILLKIPEILQCFDNLKLNRYVSATATDGSDALRACISIGEELRAWEVKALAECHEALRSTTGIHEQVLDPALSTPSLLEACTQFDHSFLQLVLVYWASTLMLYGSAQLESCTLPQPVDPSQRVILPPWFDPQPYASKITQRIGLLFTPEAGLWGTQRATFPLGTVMHYYAATNNMKAPEFLNAVAAMNSSPGMIAKTYLQSLALQSPRVEKQEEDLDTWCSEDYPTIARSWYGTNEQYDELPAQTLIP